MMPEGLLEKLSDDEVRDLIAYLASKDTGCHPEAEEMMRISPDRTCLVRSGGLTSRLLWNDDDHFK